MTSRARLSLGAVLTLAVLVPAPPAVGAPAPVCPVADAGFEGGWDGDIDGDVQSDLVIGDPKGASSDSHDGQVRVLLSSGSTQTIVRQPAALRSAGGRFGSALALGDLDDDGCSELIVGAPGGRGRAGAPAAGALYVLKGSGRGVVSTGGRILTPSLSQAGQEFGRSLALEALTDYNRPMPTTLWVGAPGLDVGGVHDAGGIYQYEIDTAGVPRPVGLLTLKTKGVPGDPRPDDRFGEVLSALEQTSDRASNLALIVGIPRADTPGKRDSGAVMFLAFTLNGRLGLAELWTQDRKHVPDKAEASDQFGAAVSGGAVGVPGEDLGGMRDAGMVQRFLIGESGKGLIPSRAYTQRTRGVPGTAEAGDRFGAAVAVGTFFCEESDMAIGSPGEDLGRHKDAGTVTLVSVPPSEEPCKARLIRQGRPPLRRAAAESGDRFGTALSQVQGMGQVDEYLLVGAPGEDARGRRDAGIVHELDLGEKPNVAESFAGPRTGARYGQVLLSWSTVDG